MLFKKNYTLRLYSIGIIDHHAKCLLIWNHLFYNCHAVVQVFFLEICVFETGTFKHFTITYYISQWFNYSKTSISSSPYWEYLIMCDTAENKVQFSMTVTGMPTLGCYSSRPQSLQIQAVFQLNRMYYVCMYYVTLYTVSYEVWILWGNCLVCTFIQLLS